MPSGVDTARLDFINRHRIILVNSSSAPTHDTSSALCAVFYVALLTILCKRHYDGAPFTDEATESQST